MSDKQTKTTTDASAVAYRYVATGGEHFVGIPQRDLTHDEFDALNDENKENVTKSGIYEEAK